MTHTTLPNIFHTRYTIHTHHNVKVTPNDSIIFNRLKGSSGESFNRDIYSMKSPWCYDFFFSRDWLDKFWDGSSHTTIFPILVRKTSISSSKSQLWLSPEPVASPFLTLAVFCGGFGHFTSFPYMVFWSSKASISNHVTAGMVFTCHHL